MQRLSDQLEKHWKRVQVFFYSACTYAKKDNRYRQIFLCISGLFGLVRGNYIGRQIWENKEKDVFGGNHRLHLFHPALKVYAQSITMIIFVFCQIWVYRVEGELSF